MDDDNTKLEQNQNDNAVRSDDMANGTESMPEEELDAPKSQGNEEFDDLDGDDEEDDDDTLPGQNDDDNDSEKNEGNNPTATP